MSNIKTSFLCCERDAEIIVKKLFFDSGADSDKLKRLLVITAKDCLDENNTEYKEYIDKITIADLFEKNYITLVPKIKMFENQELQSYIIISFGNFMPNATNPAFRDYTITFDIFCPTDCWDLGDYRVRPIKILEYIDNILNETKLTGIGDLQFLSCSNMVLNEHFSGYSITYTATQFTTYS